MRAAVVDRSPTPISLRHLERAVAFVQRKAGQRTGSVLEHERIGDFQARVALTYSSRGIEGLTLKDLRRTPEGLWSAPRPLDEITGFATSFLAHLKSKPTRSLMRSLISAYVRLFPADRPDFDDAVRLIAAELPRYPKLSAYNAGLVAGVFGGRDGANVLGGKLLEADANAALGRIGILEQHWQSPTVGLVEHAFRHACSLCSMERAEAIDALVRFARLADGRFRYPASQAAFVRTLLEPWRSKDPPVELRKQLQRLLIGFFGDPRIARERWESVPPDLTKILLKWLTRGSIEEFLSVVDRSLENDAHERRMWSFRRAFWIAYLDANLISEAWVVFSRRAINEARSAQMTGFGEREGGADPRSVLIMRIGDATVVEWSHNGRCWIWPKAASDDETMSAGALRRPTAHGKPPRLYERSYHSDALRHAPIFENHMGAESYSWQAKVAEHLYRLTGRRLKQADYALKRL
jgi:hypothetical protein